jgi:hypothetical protein
MMPSKWLSAFRAAEGAADHSSDCCAKSAVSVKSRANTGPSTPIGSIDTIGRGGWAREQIGDTVLATGRSPVTDNDRLAERAALVEFGADVPRAWADGFAQLDPDYPPGNVPLRRWRQFVDDVGLFLDRWAAYAVALGWTPFDLFGCDRDRPSTRIDHAGLLWLLNGNKLVALSENTATIEMTTGARQTWRRTANEPGRVLAWELSGRLVPAGEPQ